MVVEEIKKFNKDLRNLIKKYRNLTPGEILMSLEEVEKDITGGQLPGWGCVEIEDIENIEI